MASPLDTKADNENVWVENLKSGDSVYRSSRTNDPYPMTGNGTVGSVISVPVKVAKEAYFRRALSRGALQLLTDDQADAREVDLVLVEGADHDHASTMEALEKGASEVGSRYKNKNLSDDGSEGRSITAKEVWANREPAKGQGQVRRSTANEASDTSAADITAPAIPLGEVPDGPIPAIVTEPVKEGEWKSDTGLE